MMAMITLAIIPQGWRPIFLLLLWLLLTYIRPFFPERTQIHNTKQNYSLFFAFYQENLQRTKTSIIIINKSFVGQKIKRVKTTEQNYNNDIMACLLNHRKTYIYIIVHFIRFASDRDQSNLSTL